jgi:hypothetical protein
MALRKLNDETREFDRIFDEARQLHEKQTKTPKITYQNMIFSLTKNIKLPRKRF